jgi:RNA polymerase sigma-70 factor, ECF subfamily
MTAPASRGDADTELEVSPASMTDADLVRRVLDGDVAAFTALVDRHASSCLRFATRMLGDVLDAEDATQETLVRAYRALARYQERQQFRTWLFQILVNRCRTIMRRRQHRARFFVIDDDVVRRAPGPPLVDMEIGDDVRDAIATLDAQLREAFLLKHVEQLSYDEMHAITGASVPALKMRVKRACERLRTALRQATDA